MKVYHVQGEAPLHNDRAETWYYDFFGHFYAQNLDFLGGAEFGTIPPELRNVTDIADISV